MDLSNLLGDITGGGADTGSLTVAMMQMVQSHGGVQGLVEKLQNAGLGGAVESWVSGGSHEAVDPHQLANALGPDTVNSLAASSGVDITSLLPLLASLLPLIVDHLTPGGSLPEGGGVGDLSGLGSLIGNMLGGGSGGLGGLEGK